jgi:hypothetical protein
MHILSRTMPTSHARVQDMVCTAGTCDKRAKLIVLTDGRFEGLASCGKGKHMDEALARAARGSDSK